MADSLPAGFVLDQPAEAAVETPDGQELPAGFQLDEERYGSLGQQLASAAEGAASSLSFGLSTGAERALGVPAQDIRMRQEINPVSHGAGELVGLGAGMILGTGEAAALEKIGAGVAGRIAGESALSKIGSMAARVAAENAAFQGGDEVSKMFAGDPGQTVGTALADVGLSALIGGGLGAGIGSVPAIWKATAGRGVESVLNAVKGKAGGIEGMTSQPIREALDATGMEVAPEVRAMLSEDPRLQHAAKALEQSDTTKSGLEFQKTLTNAKHELANVALSSLGHDAASVEKLADVSKYEAGKSVGNALADEIQSRVSPLAKEFEELKGKVGNVELPPDTVIETPRQVPNPQDLVGVPETVIDRAPVPGVMSQAGEKIADLAMKEGWLAADGTPVSRLYKFVQRNLGKQKSLTDLGNFISRVGEMGESLITVGGDRSSTRAAGLIKGILRDAESGVIESKLGEQGADLVERFKNVRQAWREASELIDDVREQIGVRGSTSGYAKAVREMAQQDGEALLRRIAGSGNAAGLKLLQEKFPAAAEAFRRYHIDALVKEAAAKAKDSVINPKALARAIDKLSPEMRAFLIPGEAAQKIGAVEALLNKLESLPHNFSNTARTADKLMQHVPGGAVAMVAMATGHNPLLAAALGALTKHLTRDTPDAIRLSLLKFMGSNQAIDSGAFKAMSDFARAVYRGEAAVNAGAKAVLREGSKAKIEDKVSEKDRERLDERLAEFRQEPEKLMSVAQDLGHYLPDHATSAAQIAGSAVSYLNSLRPNEDKEMPLDAELPPDPIAKERYERALDIAINPLSVFADVRDGSVTPEDLEVLQNVSPGLYARMRDKLQSEIINRESKEDTIPYKTRLGMAIFLGQPLDSTMTPQAIVSAQPKTPMPSPQMAQAKPTKSGMQKLSRLPASSADTTQAREMARAKHLA